MTGSQRADRRFAIVLCGALTAASFAAGAALIAAGANEHLDTLLGKFVAGLALVSGLAGAGSGIAQIRRMIVRSSADDVSVAFLLLLTTSMLTWLAYGIVLANPVMLCVNSVGVGVNGTALAVARRLQRRDAGQS